VPESHYRDEKFLKKFGANLKRVRREKGVSQESLANELGFSQPYIVKVESGIVNLSISHVIAFAKQLGVKPSDLVDL
jgi:transcriptional regulator with XRE-family HTH domain